MLGDPRLGSLAWLEGGRNFVIPIEYNSKQGSVAELPPDELK